MSFFVFLFCLAAAVFGGCCVFVALFYFVGNKQKSESLKFAAILLLSTGAVVFAPMFLLMVLWCVHWLFGASETASSSRMAGTFRASGAGFVESITVSPGPDHLYRHIVELDGEIVCDEDGAVKLEGAEIEFSNFTRYIDSETGRPLPTPQKFTTDSVFFFASPPSDMLKPWPEHDYSLSKQGK